MPAILAIEAVRACPLAVLTPPAGCTTTCPCGPMARGPILAGANATTSGTEMPGLAFCKNTGNFNRSSKDQQIFEKGLEKIKRKNDNKKKIKKSLNQKKKKKKSVELIKIGFTFNQLTCDDYD
jgi:hypothetical protein